MSAPPLSPLGSARSLVAPDDARFPRDLRPLAREQDLGDDALYLAWELARSSGLDESGERALVSLILASMATVRQGSTRLPIAGSDGAAHLVPLHRALGGDPAALERLLPRLASLVAVCGPPGSYRPLIVDGDWLYHERLLSAEERLVTALRTRLELAPLDVPALPAAVDDVRARPAVQRGRHVQLSDEQLRAVRAAATGRLTIVSGGPGTGKTSIIASLLRVLARLGVPAHSIALAAPTGKAANRVRESIEKTLAAIADPAPHDRELRCPEARTLHRLLGFVPAGAREGRFRHHENNRLAERVVIVDEASMIDLFLMDRLVRAVRDDAMLILLGDADQLPSVDAGAVFRDLVACVPTAVRLTQSYRMDPIDPAGRNILSVARRIQAGRPLALYEPAQMPDEPPDVIAARSSAAELAFERVELVGAGERATFCARWFSKRVCRLDDFDRRVSKVYRWHRDAFAADDLDDLAALFAHFERFRVLAATRSDAGHVNAVLHHALVERWRTLEPAAVADSPSLLAGEPVLMQHNDYDRGLFNGDQGLVLRVSEGGAPHLMLVFPRARAGDAGYAVYHLDSLRSSVQLAYAMTIHKSQGSEFDDVAVLLPDEDLPLCTRELLYTAVTRSRRSVVLVGRRDVLEAGVARQIRRFSGVADKLGTTTTRADLPANDDASAPRPSDDEATSQPAGKPPRRSAATRSGRSTPAAQLATPDESQVGAPEREPPLQPTMPGVVRAGEATPSSAFARDDRATAGPTSSSPDAALVPPSKPGRKAAPAASHALDDEAVPRGPKPVAQADDACGASVAQVDDASEPSATPDDAAPTRSTRIDASTPEPRGRGRKKPSGQLKLPF